MGYSTAFLVLALLAGTFSVGAAPLRLSELAAPDLVEKTISVSDFLAQKRKGKQATLSPVAELLVKFQSLERVRVLEVDPADEAAALELLSKRLDVQFVEENRRLKRQFVPSDPLLGEQWQHDKIQSRQAWDIGTGSHSVMVAIVDFPFNLAHPDLATNAVNGWDVVNDVQVTSGNDWHSSMSAGMVAGVLNNGIGVAGAGNSLLMPVNNAYADETTTYMMIDAAVRWATDHGARVVNVSWAGADSATINEAGRYLREQNDGILVMSGVNGSGFLNYTNQPFITAVSMTDPADALQSKYGDHIDFAAPGWLVKSTTDSGYGAGSGTSFSSPLVAGVIAVLFSIDPTLTAAQALSVLRKTSVDLGDPGWDQKFGWGRVDFYEAAWLAAAHGGSPPVWSNSVEWAEGTGLVVSAEFHPGLVYSLLGKQTLESTNWGAVDAVVQTNGQTLEYVLDLNSATQAFFKVTGEVSL